MPQELKVLKEPKALKVQFKELKDLLELKVLKVHKVLKVRFKAHKEHKGLKE